MVLEIYKLTNNFPTEEKYSLSQQMRRSAYSITMNLIEGSSRTSELEFKHYINIARGSCAEIAYQLELARDLKYIGGEFVTLHSKYTSIGKMLTNLMKKVSANSYYAIKLFQYP